jgi:hypothetical protein
MLEEFASSRALTPLFDHRTWRNENIFGVGASCHSGNDFIRIWYVSDKESFALVTYVCDWTKQEVEMADCEKIVRSIRFSARQRRENADGGTAEGGG